MKLLLALALVTASVALVPTADACVGPASCLPTRDVYVCLYDTPVECQPVPVPERVAQLLDPCTCPPP